MRDKVFLFFHKSPRFRHSVLTTQNRWRQQETQNFHGGASAHWWACWWRTLKHLSEVRLRVNRAWGDESTYTNLALNPKQRRLSNFPCYDQRWKLEVGCVALLFPKNMLALHGEIKCIFFCFTNFTCNSLTSLASEKYPETMWTSTSTNVSKWMLLCIVFSLCCWITIFQTELAPLNKIFKDQLRCRDSANCYKKQCGQEINFLLLQITEVLGLILSYCSFV